MGSFGNGLCLFLNMSFVCYEIEFHLFSTVFFINLKFICFFFLKINFCCIYRRISRIFLSLNRVAQVGLRQEFKNVLLNHLNNSEVSEGNQGWCPQRNCLQNQKFVPKVTKRF